MVNVNTHVLKKNVLSDDTDNSFFFYKYIKVTSGEHVRPQKLQKLSNLPQLFFFFAGKGIQICLPLSKSKF